MFDCQVISSAGKLTNAILSVFSWMETNAKDFVTNRTAAIDEKTKLKFFTELQSLAESQESRIDRLMISEPAKEKLLGADFKKCDDVIGCMTGYVILIGLNKNCDYIKAVAANYRQPSKKVHTRKTAGASTAQSSQPDVETASSSTASSNLPPPPPSVSSNQSDICHQTQSRISQDASDVCEFLNESLGPNREHLELHVPVEDFLQQHNLHIHQTPGNGHCLIQSWAMSTQQPLEQIKNQILQEFDTNRVIYEQAGVERPELERYIRDRNYGLNSVDAVLNMLCNACHINAFVIGQKMDYSNPHDTIAIPGVMEVRRICSHHRQDNEKILLLKSAEHYDAIS